MFERFRDITAAGFEAIAARISTSGRDLSSSRISYTSLTPAGVRITPDTAVRMSTVWACLRYLSQTVAGLPWHVMQDGDGGATIKYSHPIDWLINKRVSDEWSSFQFRETLTHWALRWGNGYAEIVRNDFGLITAMYPIHPERVTVCRDTETKKLYYEVDNGAGPKIQFDPMDIFHLRGFGEGVVGVNMIEYASQSLGWAAAAQLFGSSFFGNGANVSGVIINKAGLSPAGLARQKEAFDSLYKGAGKAHQTVHLDADASYTRIGMNAKESQLIEVHQHLVEEICRWFGVPPHKAMHLMHAHFTNVEHQSIEVVVDNIVPWVSRFEDEADYKLFGQNRLGLSTKMNLRGLLRGDFKSQNEGLEIARRNGVITADEWRSLIDMNKMPAGLGGDKFIMQAHNTTLERIGEEPVEPAANSLPAPDDDNDPVNLARLSALEQEHGLVTIA